MMCCYYPTTTVAIDDDTDFLRILTQHLGIIDCIPYSSPKKVINALASQNPFQRIQSRILKKNTTAELSESPEEHTVLFNMRGLHEEIYNQDRFRDVSVLIVDYYMEGISGIDVCEALSNHPAKKILLTGSADKEKVAIEAFNKGIIDRFISKSDANFPTRLKQAIAVLKDAYFRDLSSNLLPHIATMPMNLYQYPSYINFMRNIQEQFDAIEYFMLDTIGTSLMLDTEGKPTWLILKHESDMNNYEKLAQDQEAPQYYIDGIAKRTLIPFFFSEEDYQQPISEWKRFFYPAQVLPGKNDYYYAICNEDRGNHISKDEIISYASYCKLLKVNYEI